MATFPVSQESTDDARHGAWGNGWSRAGQIVVTHRVEGISPNGGLVTEIPPKDVINSALGLTVI